MNNDRPTWPETEFPPADPPEDRAAPGCGPDGARDSGIAARRAALLDRLGDIGVTLAEELPALARAQSRLAAAVTERLRGARPEGIAALGELAVTLHHGNVDFAQMYERICRSVRRCIALQMQIAAARRRQSSAPAGARGAAAPRPSAAGGNAAAAESSIAAEIATELRPERLLNDLYDRPEDPTGMADLGLDRPVAELVAEICADFGVDGRIWAERLGIAADAAGSAPPPEPPDRSGSAASSRAGGLVSGEMGARNRRERRAARKLLGRKPPQPPGRLSRESGCGPP